MSTVLAGFPDAAQARDKAPEYHREEEISNRYLELHLGYRA
jgi:hypothetical protein